MSKSDRPGEEQAETEERPHRIGCHEAAKYSCPVGLSAVNGECVNL